MASMPVSTTRLFRGKNLLKSVKNLDQSTRTRLSFPQLSQSTSATQRDYSSFRNCHNIERKGISNTEFVVGLPNLSNNGVHCRCHLSRHFSSGQQDGPSQENTRRTYDKADVDHFSKLADQWWNEKGGFAGLHTMNTLRVPFVKDTLLQSVEKPSASRPLSGMRLVDVGCGGGILSEPLARLGAEVLGVDASAENIAVAKAHAAEDESIGENLSYRECLVEDLAAEQGPVYDAVVASEIIEHVADPHLFAKSCVDLVKPGGSVFFTTPNRTRLSYWLVIVAAENIFRIIPKGTHDWNKFITHEELSAMLEDFGMEVRLIHGMEIKPISLRWYWTTNVNVGYALHAVKQ